MELTNKPKWDTQYRDFKLKCVENESFLLKMYNRHITPLKF